MNKVWVAAGAAVILLAAGALWYWRLTPELAATTAFSQPSERAPAADAFSTPAFELEGMEGVTSNGQLSLYYDEATAGIAVRHEETGRVWHSNPADREADSLANGNVKDEMASQLTLTYANELGQTFKMNSFADSVGRGQVETERIAGGLKVVYTIGEASSGLDALPRKIGVERFEAIKDKAGASYNRYFRLSYALRKEQGVYERLDSQLQGTVLLKTQEAFAAAGYAEADLLRDNEEHGIAAEAKDSEIFKVAIEYALDGDQLVARIPVNEIEYAASTPPTELSVLEYFGAGGAADDGYLLVPDGSGSLIYMNRPKGLSQPYAQRIYGEDLALNRRMDGAIAETARMPVFGLRLGDAGWLGIIEAGAPLASVNAASGGIRSSYNNVYASFNALAMESVRLQSGTSERAVPQFQQRLPATDFVLRFVFLEGERASYVGMAHAYQAYLLERGLLTEKAAASEASGAETSGARGLPFYVELVGDIPKRTSFLGVPYTTMKALTTFDQAQRIAEALKALSVDNIKLRLTGWFNGGVEHEVPTDVAPDRALGGRKGLLELIAYGRNEGVELYPDVAFAKLYPQRSLTYSPAKAGVRHLNRRTADLYPLDPALGRASPEAAPTYLLTPGAVPGVADRFLDSYEAYGVPGLSVRDLGELLYSDFRVDRHVDRAQSEAISTAQLGKLKDALPGSGALMVDGGNAYAFAAADHIVNAPMGGSGFNMTDESVPFYHIVLRGYVDYAGAPMNLTGGADVTEAKLRSLEYGANAYFKWIFESNDQVKDTAYNGLYSVHYRTWLDRAAEVYRELNEALGDVADERIVDHRMVRPGVYRTEYEGGKAIYVNYTAEAVQVDGIAVGARDYAAGGEGR
ncbi:hypothetical protein FE782_17645 [Paenibacillus antri]|uniref:Uncharacterized protein n=1 Tax=Paenibacillus antri TaxID=2582848 RepID=A0A5R9G3D4_9BACL|nr:DUF5696 domain-containing protein [Paenibacillus antri]TLS50872.1 hypothetical protein FE782_17645 [Paenibacillus antri]